MIFLIVIILLAILLITAKLLRRHKRQENYSDNPRYIAGPAYLTEGQPEYSEYNQYSVYDEYNGCEKPYTPNYVQYDKHVQSTLPASNKMWSAVDSGSYVNLL